MSQRNLVSKNASTERRSTERPVQWRDRFDRFLTADLTVAEFCLGEGVSVASFYHWKKRLAIPSARRRQRKADSSASGDRFVPVVVQRASVGSRLLLPGGAAIELPSELGPRQLTELIAAVVRATDRADASNASHHAKENA